MFCCTLIYVHSSIAIILMGKRELIALLNLSSWCLVMVERLFLAVPRGCLQFVIVVFPDHTHLLFLGWSRVNIEGYQEVIISKINNLFLSLKIVFVLANSVDPDEMSRTSKRKIKFLNCQKKPFYLCWNTMKINHIFRYHQD